MSTATARTEAAGSVEQRRTSMTATVISLTNTRQHIEECLHSVFGQSRAPDEVIVVDNASTDGAQDAVRRFESVRLIASTANLGYAKANNLGARAAGSDLLVFLNDDVVVDSNWLAELVRAFERDPELTAAQSLILLEREPDLINTAGHTLNYLGVAWCGTYRQPRTAPLAEDISAMSGASLAIRREAFLAVGGFDEDFFMYHEDLELSWRLHVLGYKFKLVPTSVCYHKYEFKKPQVNKLYLVERNRLMTVLQNYEPRTLAVLAPMLAVFEVGASLFALSQGELGAKLHGYSDLLRGWRQILRKRRRIQARRRVSDREFMRWLTGDLNFEEMDSSALRVGSSLTRAYWKLAQRLIAW